MKMKVKEWLPVWLENYVKPTAKEKTYTRYSEVVTHHLIPRIGELGMSEVTPLTLQQMVTELSAHGNLRTGGGLSANTVNAIVTVIQAALQVAYRLGYLPEYTADIKVAVKATVAAVKATVAAVKGIVAAIAAGGWIAVVIIVVICIIAMAVGAVFSIFTPGKGDLSLNQVIFETENEYAEQMEIYKANIPHDYIKIRGEPTAWKEALAVYMVKYKIDGEDREDVTSFTKKQAGKLKQVYRDFNTVLVTLEERTEPYTHLVQNENGEWVEVTEDRTVTDLVFTYHTATVDEIMDKYKFNKRKRQALQDLFRPDFDVLWNALFIESP